MFYLISMLIIVVGLVLFLIFKKSVKKDKNESNEHFSGSSAYFYQTYKIDEKDRIDLKTKERKQKDE